MEFPTTYGSGVISVSAESRFWQTIDLQPELNRAKDIEMEHNTSYDHHEELRWNCVSATEMSSQEIAVKVLKGFAERCGSDTEKRIVGDCSKVEEQDG